MTLGSSSASYRGTTSLQRTSQKTQVRTSMSNMREHVNVATIREQISPNTVPKWFTFDGREISGGAAGGLMGGGAAASASAIDSSPRLAGVHHTISPTTLYRGTAFRYR